MVQCVGQGGQRPGGRLRRLRQSPRLHAAGSAANLPEAWFDEEHGARREKCGVSAALVFQTKPQLALAMLQDLLDDL
jgi:hypothetical protein